MITYSDLIIGSNDQAFIDRLIDERNVDCSCLDISYVFESKDVNSAKLTNAIIREIFHYVIMRDVKDIDDQDKLIDAIFTNCFDSYLNINPEDLKTDEAKELVINLK